MNVDQGHSYGYGNSFFESWGFGLPLAVPKYNFNGFSFLNNFVPVVTNNNYNYDDGDSYYYYNDYPNYNYNNY